MSKAIRDHLRDFVAIAVLFAFGLVSTVAILLEQGVSLPSWAPGGKERFELRAELSSAQAVTPGQGQTVNIAGVRVGDITEVELADGNAVVTMEVDPEHASLIHTDATMLLRPRTGLQDMTIEVDPGHEGEQVAEGTTIPVAQTKPNVQPDEILQTLDRDTQDYLQLLLQAGGRGLGGRGEELSATFRRFEPLARDLKRIGGALAVRRDNIRRAITTFKEVSEALGSADTRLAEFVSSSNAVLARFADQEASIRESLVELPPTLRATRSALDSSQEFSEVLGPASEDLIPAAQELGPALRDSRPFFEDTLGPIEDQIRPFSRAAQTPVRHLRQAAEPLAETTTGLSGAFGELNQLTNALAYNPPGAAEEGYAFWLSWLNHNTNALFFSQDALGPMIRSMVMFGCGTAGLAEGVATPRPFLRTLQQMTNVPRSDDPRVCPPLTF
jgi:phospholipid/cholesterol/gamma-HCH transport system substrate-binding protein